MTGIDDFSAVMDIYEETNPEIVIMDVQLPKYDGFYWCRKIRQVSNVHLILIIT